MRRIKAIRDCVILLAVGCDNTPSSQTDESNNPSIASFQKAFNSQTFAAVIPYDFKVNWEDSREGYSEVLESTYYEFSLDWESDFNPDALADRHPHRATYKLIAVPGEELTFYLLQFLEPGKTKTRNLSWTDAGTFTGRVSLFDETGEKVLATIYTEGEVTDFIPEETKDKFEMWDNNGGKTDTDEMQLVCVTVTTHHCTDWYRVYSDGSREYTGRTCSGSTTSRVCSSGGSGGSGGDGGSTGGGGGGSGGGSSGGGGAPCGDPVHGCFEMEVKDKIVAFMGTIGIDNETLDGFPKLECVVDKVLDTSNMQDLITEFGMSYTNYDLIFSGRANLYNIDGKPVLGGLKVDNNNGRDNFTLLANNHLAQGRSSVEVAITYLHEAMHAEMRRYLLDNADTSTLPNFPGSITEDWESYVATRNQETDEANQELAEHQAMGYEEYITLIAEAASDFDNGRMPLSYYKALAWEGIWSYSDFWGDYPKQNEMPWDKTTKTQKPN